MKSSLTFQMILHLGSYLAGGFVLSEFAILIYKAIVLPYPPSNLSIEFLVLLGFAVVEFFRIFFAWKGNLTENPGSMILSMILMVPSVMAVVFYLIWQTYILRLEVILCGVTITMLGLHLIFSLISTVTFFTT